MTRGIETTHNGIEFRSMLEARWAAFFDIIGWDWVYEPFEADHYIPDFLIKGDLPLLIEVKPAAAEQDYRKHTDRIDKALAEVWAHDVVIVGASPLSPIKSTAWGKPTLGLLSEGPHPITFGDGPRFWDAADWALCGCGTPGVFSDSMSYALRPCNHVRGDRAGSVSRQALEDSWRMATNKVKWKPSA